jgi:hypothetical protein
MCWCKKYTYLVSQYHSIISSTVLWNWRVVHIHIWTFSWYKLQVFFTAISIHHQQRPSVCNSSTVQTFHHVFRVVTCFRSILSIVWLTWEHIMLRQPNERAMPFTLVSHYYVIHKMLRQKKKSLDSLTKSHRSRVIIIWKSTGWSTELFWCPSNGMWQDISWRYSWYCTKPL